jgi:hypothetical protein
MNIGNDERSGRGGRDDWRVRITTAVGAPVGMGIAMMLGPVVGINGFWPGVLSVTVAIILGSVLGRLVGGLLFRPSSARPPEDKKGTP